MTTTPTPPPPPADATPIPSASIPPASSEPRWLSPDEQHLWRTFLQMQKELEAQLSRQMLNDSELSMADFSVLVQLTDTPEGQARVLELARGLRWEKSRLSHHLTRMVKRGLIDRAECASDGRGSFVVITDSGRRAIEDAAPKHVETVRKLFFDPLSEGQLAQLGQVAERILAAMQGCPESDPDE
ncbi:MarR family winged helix-turn-helix transcriptional regulator [Streptacidiphilus fuscans]|uniref:Winged helix-turn-helix transcriptional regulator n=1 Tax=Streptacidiphilus fuscans TaxID=2789292 RepID=A0A931BCI6_9ACTN|nr:MarR family winged helix-turn-helix transcriptional regulator [Streptacidiphilus fuscans]MBF9071693.1 winged helix-turn-helix transcriptional regulator [Streptacidiphilus fuscans]